MSILTTFLSFHFFFLLLFLFLSFSFVRADSSRREFLASTCDRQPVVFSEEDPASPKPVKGMCQLYSSPLVSVSKAKRLEILKLHIVKYWKTITIR